ncbi:MAG: hypothetical protein ACO1OB_28775 [Archangium sp.]
MAEPDLWRLRQMVERLLIASAVVWLGSALIIVHVGIAMALC